MEPIKGWNKGINAWSSPHIFWQDRTCERFSFNPRLFDFYRTDSSLNLSFWKVAVPLHSHMAIFIFCPVYEAFMLLGITFFWVRKLVG